jgi:hypothetical protein
VLSIDAAADGTNSGRSSNVEEDKKKKRAASCLKRATGYWKRN